MDLKGTDRAGSRLLSSPAVERIASSILVVAFLALVAGIAISLHRPPSRPSAGPAPNPTAQSSATPQPAPTPDAFTGNCKLPVSWGDMGTPLSGGFISFPGASFAPDSSASGLITPYGQNWASYDTPMRKWVPVTRERLSPDGTTWLYGTLGRGMIYHAVDVSPGKDTTLWGSDRMFRLIGLDNSFAYAMLDTIGGAQLWRLPLDGSQGFQLKVHGTWQFVNHGAAWGTGSASLPPGAPFSLQRFDMEAKTITDWVQLSGPGSLVGFDANGAPIVQMGGPGGDVIVAPSPGVQRPVAKAVTFAKGPG